MRLHKFAGGGCPALPLDWAGAGCPHLSSCLEAEPAGSLPFPLGEDQPPPHLHSHTHAAPGDIPHQELKPKHKFSISQGPGCTALLGPSKALCYPLWPRIRLFAWDWELQVNKLKSRQDKSHSDSVCWTSSRQELYAPCPQFWAPVLMSAYTLAYTSCTHQQTTVPKHKPKHTLFSICKDGLHFNPFL